MSIHPTAVVAPGAQIDETTEIGPYCVIGEHVKIGPNNKLVAYVYVDGYVEIGAGNKIYPNCSIGTPPQDVGWTEDMVTYVKIGDENIIRENVTIHCGTIGSEENATTTVTEMAITKAGFICAVTANAEQMPSTCTVMGLFFPIGFFISGFSDIVLIYR